MRTENFEAILIESCMRWRVIRDGNLTILISHGARHDAVVGIIVMRQSQVDKRQRKRLQGKINCLNLFHRR